MARTITVNGVGHVSVAPDWVVLSLTLKTENKDYARAMADASEKIAELNKALVAAGFEPDSAKTSEFEVNTSYEYKRGTRTFAGYRVEHRLSVEFAMDVKQISRALTIVARCVACPEIDVAFTVKDATDVREAVLRSATENARRKAEILCAASGKALGELISIDYSWNEIKLRSNTRELVEVACYAKATPMRPIDIHPEDINASDTVTFVWEIV